MINWIANGFFLVMSAQNTYIYLMMQLFQKSYVKYKEVEIIPNEMLIKN